MGQQDVNIKKTFRPQDFAKQRPPSSAKVALYDEMLLQQDEDALNESLLDIETEESNSLSLEQREKEAEQIKLQGDKIRKENIIKNNNEFVQQSVEEVLSDIEQVRHQEELH